MKKIWVLRYNDGTSDVWDEEKGPPSWPYLDAFDVEDKLKEFQSDYAALIARHNALVEAVAWERECQSFTYRSPLSIDAMNELLRTRYAARAEVDRLIGGE